MSCEKMQDFGLVSIIMPAWNCAEFIGESIESVLSQTYSNWELLIQDDCSTDSTHDVVLKYAASDSRIKYMNNCECGREGLLDGVDSYNNIKNGSGCSGRLVNRGAALTRNAALRRAEGRWIAFLDADDLWLPDKLDHQLRFMADNGFAFTYHAYSEIAEDGCPLGVYVSGKRCVRKFDMYTCCWPGCLTVMFDASKVGLVQVADVKKNNDTAMWLKIVRNYPCHFFDEELALYRRRKESITPKPLYRRVLAHYPLFRVAEKMNPVAAMFWVLMNVFGNAFKKIFYVTRNC